MATFTFNIQHIDFQRYMLTLYDVLFGSHNLIFFTLLNFEHRLASYKWWRNPGYPAETSAYLQTTGNFLTSPGQD